MKLVVQRVSEARVVVENDVVGEIEKGLLVLVGLGKADNSDLFRDAVDKLTNLRIFSDERGNMNLSLRDIQGGLLLVSQFTLYADCKKGRRPSFINAMPPGEASALFDAFVDYTKKQFDGVVETGSFGAMMEVQLQNDGPVTIVLDSEELGWPRK